MICVGILEDEIAQQQLLVSYLERLSQERDERINVELFSDAQTFLENAVHYDILLLDIFLGENEKTGFDVAEAVRAKDRNVLILFITNLAQYAVKGYAVNAFDFVVKPVSYPDFQGKLNRAFDYLAPDCAAYITVKTQGGIVRLDVSTIEYVEVRLHNITFHTDKGQVSSSGSMTAIEAMLPENTFFRCHVAYLVNLKCVQNVDRLTAQVGEANLPISRHRRKEFMKALVNCLRDEMP